MSEPQDQQAIEAAIEEHGNLVENSSVELHHKEDRKAECNDEHNVLCTRNIGVPIAIEIAVFRSRTGIEPSLVPQASDWLWQLSDDQKEVHQELHGIVYLQIRC